jgi:hypothetical protein
MFSLFSAFRKLSSEALQAAKRARPRSKPKKSATKKKSKSTRTGKTRPEMEVGGTIGQEPSRIGVLDNRGKIGSF